MMARISGPRHLALRIIGPVAVEADHAPFHAVTCPQHAGVLNDRIVDQVLFAIG
jgi:hypothetical protein